MLFLNFGEKIITPEVAQMTVKILWYIFFKNLEQWLIGVLVHIYIDVMYESILNHLQS